MTLHLGQAAEVLLDRRAQHAALALLRPVLVGPRVDEEFPRVRAQRVIEKRNRGRLAHAPPGQRRKWSSCGAKLTEEVQHSMPHRFRA